MIEYYRTLRENGRDHADGLARELEKQGMEVLKIEEAEVPFCEGPNRKPVLVPGYRIVVDDGRPPLYRRMVDGEARWLWT